MNSVFPQWKHLQTESYRSRDQMTLFIGNNLDVAKILFRNKPDFYFSPLDASPEENFEATKDYHMTISLAELNQKNITNLIESFPKLTSLQLILHDIPQDDMSNIVFLLNRLASKLTSFYGWVHPQQNLMWILDLDNQIAAMFTKIPRIESLDGDQLKLFGGKFIGLINVYIRVNKTRLKL